MDTIHFYREVGADPNAVGQPLSDFFTRPDEVSFWTWHNPDGDLRCSALVVHNRGQGHLREVDEAHGTDRLTKGRYDEDATGAWLTFEMDTAKPRVVELPVPIGGA